MSNSVSTADFINSAMAKVYGVMGIGLFITFLLASFIGTDVNMLNAIFNSGWKWPVILAPLAVIFTMSYGRDNFSAVTLFRLFGLFAALEGVSLSVIFAHYAQADIAATFMITSIMFGGMALYGYTTKRDLSSMGSILFLALIGIMLAMIVNMFLHSSMMQLVISVLGVLLFLGFTAYDSQDIKNELAYTQDTNKTIVMGAVNLYLDFINLFLFLLNLQGRDD